MIENIEIVSKFEVSSKKILALTYTPGVAKSSLEISKNRDRVFDLTNRSNSIAVLSNDYKKSLSRAIYIKKHYSIDAYPFEIKECSKDELELVIKNIMPNFMGVDTVLLNGGNIEDKNTIPTKSKTCFIQNNLEDFEPVRLREMFGGVIETKVYIQNGVDIKKPVAIVSDGSAVLGLGNIGACGALPVMEGKSALFQELGGVSAVPICLYTQDVQEIIKICTLLENSFSGINLEDISAPRCFEIENTLINTLNIPVFHDDQHGTAIVVGAGLLNALEVVKKDISSVKIIMSGAGAAGCAVCKHLFKLGAKNITMFNKFGIVKKDDPKNDFCLNELAKKTNLNNKNITLKEAMCGADVFIGVSAGGILSASDIENMNENAIVFALANPTPEIMPDIAIKAGAKIVATGRSDFSNQINNSLVFPALFRGVIESKISKITDDIKITATVALKTSVREHELSENYIIPDALNKNVAKNISACIIDYVRNSKTHA